MLGFRNSCIEGFMYAGMQMQGIANAGLSIVAATSYVLQTPFLLTDLLTFPPNHQNIITPKP